MLGHWSPADVVSQALCRVNWDPEHRVLIFPQSNARQRGRSVFARGLTKTISAAFSPEFSISLVLKAVPVIKTKKHGKRVGNMVDEQLNTWANSGLQPCNYAEDGYFIQIRTAIEEQKWIPLCAQLPVGCVELRLATKLDLLCLDLKGRVIIVELKCGFDDYFDIHNQGCMMYPFQHVPTSFRHKAWLQLLLTTYLYFHTDHPYRNRPFGGSYILHVYEKANGNLTSSLKPLPYWTYASNEMLQQCLCVLQKTRFQNQKDRRRLIQNGARRSRYQNRWTKTQRVESPPRKKLKVIRYQKGVSRC